MEFYYIIHYVIYRYYRKNLESRTMSMCRACSIHDFIIWINRKY